MSAFIRKKVLQPKYLVWKKTALFLSIFNLSPRKRSCENTFTVPNLIFITPLCKTNKRRQRSVVEWKQIDNGNSYVFILHESSVWYNFTNDMNNINKLTVMYTTLNLQAVFIPASKDSCIGCVFRVKSSKMDSPIQIRILPFLRQSKNKLWI